MSRQRLVLRTFPPSLNRIMSMHWAKRKTAKETFTEAVYVDVLEQGISEAEGRRKVSMTFFWPDKRRRDPDNHIKWALDSLVICGLLLDDSPEWAEVAMPVFAVDRDNPRIEIVLEEA